MGCSLCNPAKDVVEEDSATTPKEYSWDKKPKIDPNDFMIENLHGDDVCRLSGSVNGQQFVIQNCSNSVIFILDCIDSINVDECANCKIVLGPVKGSVFVRDCLDCVLVVPCGQFRLRDSHRLDIFLHCATQPIIESSTHIRFACIRLQYNSLKDHMKLAGLSAFNNLWSNIHDFTPNEGDGNWRKLPQKVRLQDYITPPFPPHLREAGWTVSGTSEVFPLSLGELDFSDLEICFVLVFGDSNNQQGDTASEFLTTLLSLNDKCVLLTSREVQLHSMDATALQLGSDEEKKLEDGPVVGLVIGGQNCLPSCFQVFEHHGFQYKVYISPNQMTAVRQASSFQQCATMHLGC